MLQAAAPDCLARIFFDFTSECESLTLFREDANDIVNLLAKHPSISVIVYCLSRVVGQSSSTTPCSATTLAQVRLPR